MSLLLNDKDNLTARTLVYKGEQGNEVVFVDQDTAKPEQKRLTYRVAIDKLKNRLEQLRGIVTFPLDASDYYDGMLPPGQDPGSVSMKYQVIAPKGVKTSVISNCVASANTGMVTVAGNAAYFFNLVASRILPRA